MSKKIKNHVKHEKYKDHNISPLESHVNAQGELASPFNRMGFPFTFSSWRDESLNEFLWAIIVRVHLGQEKTLEIFRNIILVASVSEPHFEETFISHSALSILNNEQFDKLMSPLLKDADARELLSALLLIESLPDLSHWKRHLVPQKPERDLITLQKAVFVCSDHQSQETTDIRWLKLMYVLLIQKKMTIPEQMAENFRLYPNYGDQRSVRPSVRAAEQLLRVPHEKSDIPFEIPKSKIEQVPSPWHSLFWKECLDKTPCIYSEKEGDQVNSDKHYFKQFSSVYGALSDDFMKKTHTTSINSRMDGAYGLILYSLQLGLSISRNRSTCFVEGRIILRTAVENYITLKYLAHTDNPTLWHQFRLHGTGQSKLTFLKNLREEDIPDFINLDELYNYANEDMWQEFNSIKIKPWANKNLRTMAMEANIKEFYDKYYDWSSAFVHGNWAAIRDSVFTTCLNPLHRFHRIPKLPKPDLPSVLKDFAKILNMMLEINNQLYPTFKERIKHPTPK